MTRSERRIYGEGSNRTWKNSGNASSFARRTRRRMKVAAIRLRETGVRPRAARRLCADNEKSTVKHLKKCYC
jgi:hypothetical protein